MWKFGYMIDFRSFQFEHRVDKIHQGSTPSTDEVSSSDPRVLPHPQINCHNISKATSDYLIFSITTTSYCNGFAEIQPSSRYNHQLWRLH